MIFKVSPKIKNKIPNSEKKLIKQTIKKLQNNEFHLITYKEAKLSINFLDNSQLVMSEYSMNLETDEINETKTSASIKYQEIKESIHENLDTMITEIQDLLEFSKKLDDNFILSYVDGHTDEVDNNFFERLIRIDEELEKEVKLLMKANSFFGRVGDEIKENPDALAELIKFENNLKKNEINSALENNKIKKIFDSLKDVITLKPINFAFSLHLLQ